MSAMASIADRVIRITSLRHALAKAQRACDRATAARAALPAGSSRARVTTANARWKAKCEARDRIAAELAEMTKEGA